MKDGWLKPAKWWKGALKQYQYALLIVAVGAALMLLPTGGGGTGERGETQTGQEESFDLAAFETRLAQTLSQITGAGPTRVVLTVDSGSRRVLAQDREQDRDGASSLSTVTLGRGSGTQEVVPLQVLAPSFRGALVVCPGGGDPQVRLKLAEAVSALTGLGTDRISICEGNGSTSSASRRNEP